jgi:DNA-binding CsgD family transcriptional regulator
MRLRRSRLSAEVEAAANIVNCLSTAAALFATDGTLLDANEAAERILAPTGDEVGCERAELSLGDDGLQRIVRSFAESGAPARTTVLRDRGGGSVLVHAMRRDPEKVGPLTRLQRVHEKLPEPCVLVLLKRPGEVDGHATRVLAESFGLTPAETRLAMLLMEGRPMAECASVLGISRNTARNQLASTMGKTASRSQADLVRLFASGGGGTCHSTQPY